MSEWIKCSDRLPDLKQDSRFPNIKESDFVIVCHNLSDSHMSAPSPWIVYLYQYKDEEPAWQFIGENGIGEVSHWMPLPKGPHE